MDGLSQIQPKRQLDKILLIGESNVGKKSLILAYLNRDKKNPEWRHAARIEDYPFHIAGTNLEITLAIVQSTDCSGYGDQSSILDQWHEYPNTSVILICVDAGHYTAEEKPDGVIRGVWSSVYWAKERWAKEVFYFFGSEKMDWGRSQEPKWRKGLREGLREDCLRGSNGRKPPLLVVGCQIDAKVEGQGLTFEEGKKLAGDIGAESYFECSATTGEGVKEVFEEAARLALAFADSDTGKKRRSLWRSLRHMFGS